MERLWDMVNYLFGVSIVEFDGVLTIEGRRPTEKVGLSLGAVLLFVGAAAWVWLTGLLIIDAYTITLTLAPIVVALYFIVTGNFREAYVFDKKNDSYTFTRQSVLRREVWKGAQGTFARCRSKKE
jgi:hypothetical protein